MKHKIIFFLYVLFYGQSSFAWDWPWHDEDAQGGQWDFSYLKGKWEYKGGKMQLNVSPGHIFLTIQNMFRQNSTVWATALTEVGGAIFYVLLALNLLKDIIIATLDAKDIIHMITLIAKQVVVGAMFSLWLDKQDFLNSLVQYALDQGLKLSGLSESISAGSIMDMGFYTFVDIMGTSFSEFTTNIPLIIITAIFGLIITVSFALIALDYFMVYIELYIVSGVGVIMLGLSASEWTRSMFFGYIKFFISASLRALTTYFILGVLVKLLTLYKDIYTDGKGTATEFLTCVISELMIVMVLMLIMKGVAKYVGSMMSGSLQSAQGGAIFGAVTATVASGTAMMAIATEFGRSGINGLTGLAKALGKGNESSNGSTTSKPETKIADVDVGGKALAFQMPSGGGMGLDNRNQPLPQGGGGSKDKGNNKNETANTGKSQNEKQENNKISGNSQQNNKEETKSNDNTTSNNQTSEIGSVEPVKSLSSSSHVDSVTPNKMDRSDSSTSTGSSSTTSVSREPKSNSSGQSIEQKVSGSSSMDNEASIGKSSPTSVGNINSSGETNTIKDISSISAESMPKADSTSGDEVNKLPDQANNDVVKENQGVALENGQVSQTANVEQGSQQSSVDSNITGEAKKANRMQKAGAVAKTAVNATVTVANTVATLAKETHKFADRVSKL